MLTESTYKGLSGVRGNSHAPFLGGGGAAMCRCYPPRLRKSEQQKRHNRKMPHTMTGRKGSAAGAALLHFRQA
ncbi:hypothetical protein C4829_23870 [Salmonella enterica subsp. enterica serovar Rubislaw]|nr:hypothetical protein [Salmonella enterica]EDI6408018.1 hypothetical protein [Salmonella enterica subsp. enterica serovar Typhimurium]PVK28977.1 hypothetical protein C4840_24030 [Salmonella enterica subsp. enterica serovar Braenderup]PVK45591.1 hypothetical protein C4829_23870 [Salmonella enterica subsp. enterica serovar Rubislaw]EAY5425537.1 hypothetical protein [Salmonella enterica]